MAEKRLNIKIGADLTDMSARLKQAGQMAKRALKGAGLIAIAGTAGALYAGARAYKAAASELDRLAKTARQFQMDPSQLRGFQIAAEIGGSSAENLNSSLQRLDRRAAMAAAGFGAGKRAIQQLNLDAKAMIGLPLGEQFLMVVDSINKLESSSEQASAAFGLFGREGQNLLETIRQGRGGMEGFIAEVRRLNPELTDLNLGKLEEANDAVLLMNQALKSIRNTFAIAIAPAVRRFAEMMRENVIQPVNEAIRALGLLDLESVGQSIGTGLKVAAEAFRDIMQILVGATVNGSLLRMLGSGLKYAAYTFVNTITSGLNSAFQGLKTLLLGVFKAGIQYFSEGLELSAKLFGDVLRAAVKDLGVIFGKSDKLQMDDEIKEALSSAKTLREEFVKNLGASLMDAADAVEGAGRIELLPEKKAMREFEAYLKRAAKTFDSSMREAMRTPEDKPRKTNLLDAVKGLISGDTLRDVGERMRKILGPVMQESILPAANEAAQLLKREMPTSIGIRVDELTRIGAVGRRAGVQRQIQQERIMRLQLNVLESIDRKVDGIGGGAAYQ